MLYLNVILHLALVATSLLFSVSVTAQKTSPAPWVGQSFSGSPCNGKGGAESEGQDFLIVGSKRAIEAEHFTRDVESLKHGSTTANPVDDLDYMLNKFPNHHRALHSRITLQINADRYRWRQKHVPSAECYLLRAMNFSPRDATSHMLYGILLHRSGKFDEALVAYKDAESISSGDIQIKYNIGLLLYDMEQYEASADYAVEVYDRGFPLMGLQKKLANQGMWPVE